MRGNRTPRFAPSIRATYSSLVRATQPRQDIERKSSGSIYLNDAEQDISMMEFVIKLATKFSERIVSGAGFGLGMGLAWTLMDRPGGGPGAGFSR